jgi:hypothetical protein
MEETTSRKVKPTGSATASKADGSERTEFRVLRLPLPGRKLVGD